MRLLLLAVIVLLPTFTLAVPSAHVLTGKVVKVTDGDTITVLTEGDQQERIRLYGIDAPNPEATNLIGRPHAIAWPRRWQERPSL